MEKITFSLTSFFDPMGDGKTARKVFKRSFYHSTNDRESIKNFVDTVLNASNSYYGEKLLKFKNYKKTKSFII
jgi:hypothetical protein